MPKLDVDSFPRIRTNEMLDEDAVLDLARIGTIALNGIVCAIDLRDMPIDPLYELETALGVRLNCETDKGGPRLGSTFASLHRIYDRMVTKDSEILIASIDAEPIDKEPLVTARYYIPTLRPGDQGAAAIKVVYGSRKVKPKGHKKPFSSLAKLSLSEIKKAQAPLMREPNGKTTVFIEGKSGRAVASAAATNGRNIGTI